jgi:hypothetical protein
MRDAARRAWCEAIGAVCGSPTIIPILAIQSMIRKSGRRFSEKIMLKQKDRAG